ncbi:acyltransferase family protein [Paenibacillus massiliensis]|uniref:acyltransferase family protein n=1 Tax=Paenibacillus massiliensis TaxID=225917 RepID=UPI000471E4EB|nr:acyltransferase family protein [Paenibacillus massiliensis]
MSPLTKSTRHMNGLDGLRALSVLAVIAYHLGIDSIPGGLLGVGIFFVLSGYLITDLLLKEWQDHGHISLKEFWLRRARRLLPAMLTMMLVVLIWLLFTDPTRLSALRGDVIAGLLYISNWYNIVHQVSYFESFGPPSPFGHFWSLAVEEQFYVLWPILLMLAIALLRKKGLLIAAILGAAVVSITAMAILYNPDIDPSRVYYGTDTRAFALLIGAALAVIWPSRKLSSSLSLAERTVLDLTGVVALALLVWMMLSSGEYDEALYRGGMAVQALAAAVLIAVLAHPSSILARLVGSLPLRWMGQRSYGMYLWHYPVIVLTSPLVETGGAHPLRMLMQFTATLLLSSLSLKYIENPIRYNGFGLSWSRFWNPGRYRRGVRHVWWRRAALLLTMGILSLSVTEMLSPTSAHSNHQQGQGGASAGDTATVQAPADGTDGGNKPDKSLQAPHQPRAGDAGSKGAGASSLSSSQSHAQAQSDASEEPAPVDGNPSASSAPTPATDGGADSIPAMAAENAAPKDYLYTVIGDSVILDAEPYLEDSLERVYVDGHIGRQMWQAADIIKALQDNQQLGKHVVLELGTNGSFNSKDLYEVLDSLKATEKVYLVTVRVPRPWERNVNRALNKAATKYDNVTLIDWYSASAGHDDYFIKDGVHLTKTGAQAFAALLKKNIR